MFAQQTLRGFRFIEEYGQGFYANRVCAVLDVSSRGLRAYRSLSASQRQQTDMIVLAHIRCPAVETQFR